VKEEKKKEAEGLMFIFWSSLIFSSFARTSSTDKKRISAKASAILQACKVK